MGVRLAGFNPPERDRVQPLNPWSGYHRRGLTSRRRALSVLLGIPRRSQSREPARQIRPTVHHVQDDHTDRHLDEHDKMLPRPREAQILRQVGIDEAA